MEYEVCEYNDEWAIYAKTSSCYVLFGSKEDMEKRCEELNNEEN